MSILARIPRRWSVIVTLLAAVLFTVVRAWGYTPIAIPAADYLVGVDIILCNDGVILHKEYNLSGSPDFVEVRAFFHQRDREPKEVPFLIFEYPMDTEDSVPARRIDLILPYQSPRPVTVEYLQATYPGGVCDIPRLPKE